MRSKLVWTAVVLMLVTVIGIISLIFPFRPEVTPGGMRLDLEERDVLTEIPRAYRPELAPFTVRVGDIRTPYRLFSTFVMPRERVEIAVTAPTEGSTYRIEADSGAVAETGPGTWTWTAPAQPGVYPVHVDELPSRFSMTLNAFVLRPYSVTSAELNGYRVGNYETTPYQGDSAYVPPRGLVEVTPELQNVLVSPHFTLGQFLCKQESSYPKYLLLRERLLLKLELLLRELNEIGMPVRSLHVMSAYRTPFYNRLIGNTTTYSRHLYGGAADILVDRDGDTNMDDLNGDGSVDREDAVFLARTLGEALAEAGPDSLVGGLGIYGPAAHRGPFIHVDVRGKQVRW